MVFENVAKRRKVKIDLLWFTWFKIDFLGFKIDFEGNNLDKSASQSKVIAWPFKFEKERLNTKEKNSTFLTILLG